MLKKFMTGLIALILMAGSLGTISSFSDYEDRVAPKQATEGTDGKFNEDREAKKNEILSIMYPEILDIQAQLKTDFDSSKKAVKLIKDQFNIVVGIDKEVQEAENIAFLESVESKVESNKITKEEATELIDNYKETQKAANEAIFNMSYEDKVKLKEMKVQFASFKEESENISKEVTAAVNSDNAAAFKVAFDNIITILGTTNSLDKKRVQEFTDILYNLQ